MTNNSRKVYKLLPNLYVGSWMMLDMPDQLRAQNLTNILALYKQSAIEGQLIIFKPIRLPDGTRGVKQIKRKNITFPNDFTVHQVPVTPFDEPTMQATIDYMEAMLHTGQNLLIVAPNGNRDERMLVVLACYLLKQGFPMAKIWETLLSNTKGWSFGESQWQIFMDRAGTDWETLRQMAWDSDKT